MGLRIIYRYLISPSRVFKKIKTYIDFYYLKAHGVETSLGFVVLNGFPIIQKFPGSRIILGKGTTLTSHSKYNVAGINHPVILATLSESAMIKIGTVGISGSSICAAKKIEIKNYSGLGANSKLYDSDFHVVDPQGRKLNIGEVKSSPIIIGENVWIASDVTILKGVQIGEGSVVGAGSVVTKSIPPNELHAGNPARKIRELNSSL
jgi:acetyltransferase-like isoleucine patch superfamily enzyme